MRTNSPLLDDAFDAVVLLTGSDGRSQPRSDPYHFATRFARRWPVLFVQATFPEPDASPVQAVEGHDILIVHAGDRHDDEQASFLQELLRERGVKKPLYWIYNPRFAGFLEQRPGQLHVVHATEDYFGGHDELGGGDEAATARFRRVLAQSDLVVAVTTAIGAGIREQGRYRGAMIVAWSGCDVTHWRPAESAEIRQKTAICQGSINERVDYDLLQELTERLPDWRFWFCGDDAAAPLREWSRIRGVPNVEWRGALDHDDLVRLQAQATVGLMPFRQASDMRGSLPLKAYEYVASGLPVVTIPIDELADQPDLFHFATDAPAFAKAMTMAAAKRGDTVWLARAAEAAAAASYDSRFEAVMDKLAVVIANRSQSRRKRNVLVLYDSDSIMVATIREHLEAFARYSAHHIYYLPAAGKSQADLAEPDLSLFDVVILHYSVRLSVSNHILPSIAQALERFSGVKIAFLQDEYETTDVARAWIKRFKFDVLFSCVPMQYIDNVYPRSDFPSMRIVPTLTGYVPDDADIELHQRPMRERKLTIAYRGRRLPHFYGDLGQEKLWIGLGVRKEAEARGIPVDIEVDEEHRIYGRAWYEFLANSRATLATESGSNVFDFDGSLKAASWKHAKLPYETFRERFLTGREGSIRMNQISPKVFEAIRLRVALILFEGEYSGVVKPDVHYIPLKKDLSNIDTVFAKLDDLELLESMADRAYRDVLGDGRYSYRAFAEHVDAEIALATGLQRTRAQFFSVPALVACRGQLAQFPALPDLQPASDLLPDGFSRTDFMTMLRYHHQTELAVLDIPESGQPAKPQSLSRLSRLRERLSRNPARRPLTEFLGRLWDQTPQPIKRTVRKILR